MANGQPFNMYADTVAHPSLPLGTRLRLTNPANGRSVEVKVTDRGPYIRGRGLDLSYAVAQKLGVVQSGVSRIVMRKS
jgi:rare lipoprotein A